MKHTILCTVLWGSLFFCSLQAMDLKTAEKEERFFEFYEYQEYGDSVHAVLVKTVPIPSNTTQPSSTASNTPPSTPVNSVEPTPATSPRKLIHPIILHGGSGLEYVRARMHAVLGAAATPFLQPVHRRAQSAPARLEVTEPSAINDNQAAKK